MRASCWTSEFEADVAEHMLAGFIGDEAQMILVGELLVLLHLGEAVVHVRLQRREIGREGCRRVGIAVDIGVKIRRRRNRVDLRGGVAELQDLLDGP